MYEESFKKFSHFYSSTGNNEDEKSCNPFVSERT